MASYFICLCIALCLFQNALAQLGLGSSLSNLANQQISGNSIVSNNIGIGNFAGTDTSNLASTIGNGLTSNLGSNLASNIVNSVTSNIGSSLASNVGSNLASSIGKNIAGNSVVANNIGLNLGSSTGSLTSLGGPASSGGLNVGSFSNSVGNMAFSTTNLAGGVGAATANSVSNNLVIGNTGSIAVGNVGGISNFRVGEIELVNDVSVNRGYSGDLPIIGYVTFEGYIPAEGTVSVAKDCGCTG